MGERTDMSDKKFRDLTGQRFERYTVQWPIGRDRSHNIKWLCLCDCGVVKAVSTRHLITGQIKSCGCYNRENTTARNKANTVHGKSQTIEGDLLYSARDRAKKAKMPCNITIEDIVIPDICPLLNIPLRKQNGNGHHRNSPSIDRINPKLGYIKGNIQIISVRANSIKNDSTLEEFELIAKNWRKQCQ